MDLFKILLFLHVLGAIVAFGPGFASMVVGPMVGEGAPARELLRADADHDARSR